MKTRTLERLWLRALPRLTRDYRWVSVDGLRLYGSTQHQLMLYWLVKGSYERYTRKLFQRSIEDGSGVLDVGAHIGYYTLLAARRVGPTGRVYAFECDPANFRFLRHNVDLSGMQERVRCIQKAAAETAGVHSFFSNPANTLQSSLWASNGAEEPVAVQTAPVDDIVPAEERIDVVKIDVEGAEVEALRGMRDTVGRADRLALFVECNPGALAAAEVSASMLLDELAQLGLDVHVIDEKRRSLDPLDESLTDPAREAENFYVNLYCTKGTARPE